MSTSNIQTVRPGKSIQEVQLTLPTPGTTVATSAALSLGKSYSSIKCISIGCKGVSGLVQASYVPDTSSTVKLRYISAVNEAITITALFECEV